MNDIRVLEVTDKKTQFGKPMKQLKVAEFGTEYKTNIFSNFPDFGNIEVDYVIRGKMLQNGKYWEISTNESQIVPERPQTPYKPPNKPSTAGMKEVIDYKDQKIGIRVDDKDWSIMTSSTMRDAVQLALAEYEDKTVLDNLADGILKWRAWLLENWEVNEKDVPPFK